MNEDNELCVTIVIDGVRTHDYEKMRNFFHVMCGALSGMMNTVDYDTLSECGYPYYTIEDSAEARKREEKEAEE